MQWHAGTDEGLGPERGEIPSRSYGHGHRHKPLWQEIVEWLQGRSEHAADHDHSDGDHHDH